MTLQSVPAGRTVPAGSKGEGAISTNAIMTTLDPDTPAVGGRRSMSPGQHTRTRSPVSPGQTAAFRAATRARRGVAASPNLRQVGTSGMRLPKLAALLDIRIDFNPGAPVGGGAEPGRRRQPARTVRPFPMPDHRTNRIRAAGALAFCPARPRPTRGTRAIGGSPRWQTSRPGLATPTGSMVPGPTRIRSA